MRLMSESSTSNDRRLPLGLQYKVVETSGVRVLATSHDDTSGARLHPTGTFSVGSGILFPFFLLVPLSSSREHCTTQSEGPPHYTRVLFSLLIKSLFGSTCARLLCSLFTMAASANSIGFDSSSPFNGIPPLFPSLHRTQLPSFSAIYPPFCGHGILFLFRNVSIVHLRLS